MTTMAQMQSRVHSLQGNDDLTEELNRITADLAREFADTCSPAAIQNAVLHVYQRLTSYTRTTVPLLPLIRTKTHITINAITLPHRI